MSELTTDQKREIREIGDAHAARTFVFGDIDPGLRLLGLVEKYTFYGSEYNRLTSAGRAEYEKVKGQ